MRDVTRFALPIALTCPNRPSRRNWNFNATIRRFASLRKSSHIEEEEEKLYSGAHYDISPHQDICILQNPSFDPYIVIPYIFICL